MGCYMNLIVLSERILDYIMQFGMQLDLHLIIVDNDIVSVAIKNICCVLLLMSIG